MPPPDRAVLSLLLLVLCQIAAYELWAFRRWGLAGTISERCWRATQLHPWLPLAVLLAFAVLYLHCFFREPF